jgi:hypothetical protein
MAYCSNRSRGRWNGWNDGATTATRWDRVVIGLEADTRAKLHEKVVPSLHARSPWTRLGEPGGTRLDSIPEVN